jgi:alkanesulfonate monooxygenase
VAEAILDYYDLRIEEVLIRRFNPLQDARDYGRELIPVVKKKSPRAKARAA